MNKKIIILILIILMLFGLNFYFYINRGNIYLNSARTFENLNLEDWQNNVECKVIIGSNISNGPNTDSYKDLSGHLYHNKNNEASFIINIDLENQKIIQQNMDQGKLFTSCTGCFTEYDIVENQDDNLIFGNMHDSMFMKNIVIDLRNGEFRQTTMDERESKNILIERGYCEITKPD